MSADSVQILLLYHWSTSLQQYGRINNISPASLQAQAFTDSNITEVSSYEELKTVAAERRWARGAWAGDALSCTKRQLLCLAVLSEYV